MMKLNFSKRTFLFLTIPALLLIGLVLQSVFFKEDVKSSTVSITNLRMNSGGSGSIIYSSMFKSKVLTNKHVCKLIRTGGFVRVSYGDYAGNYLVRSFQEFAGHDLCVITVNSYLGNTVSLSNSPPETFEEATIVGHPKLNPITKTTGHIGQRKIIQILTGIVECTEQQKNDPELGILCFFLGGLPQIEIFDALYVTALVMPGSSGSAIYNNRNEIVSVVFAGGQDLSFAYAVPYEYISEFLSNLNQIPSVEVSSVIDKPLSDSNSTRKEEALFRARSLIQEVCSTKSSTTLNKVQKKVLSNYLCKTSLSN